MYDYIFQEPLFTKILDKCRRVTQQEISMAFPELPKGYVEFYIILTTLQLWQIENRLTKNFFLISIDRKSLEQPVSAELSRATQCMYRLRIRFILQVWRIFCGHFHDLT